MCIQFEPVSFHCWYLLWTWDYTDFKLRLVVLHIRVLEYETVQWYEILLRQFFSSLFQNLRGLYLSCDIPFSLNACHWLLPYLVLMMMVTVQVTHSQPSYFLAVLYKMPTLILIYVCFWWFSYFWIGSYFFPWWFLIRIILGE